MIILILAGKGAEYVYIFFYIGVKRCLFPFFLSKLLFLLEEGEGTSFLFQPNITNPRMEYSFPGKKRKENEKTKFFNQES